MPLQSGKEEFGGGFEDIAVITPPLAAVGVERMAM